MGTHPIFESDFDCLTDKLKWVKERKPVTNTNFSSTTKKREPFWVVLEDHGLKSLCSISLTSHSLQAYSLPQFNSCRVNYQMISQNSILDSTFQDFTTFPNLIC